MNQMLLIIIDFFIFLLGALAHLGIPIPLGVITWKEPVVYPAAIVEGLGALFLAISILTRMFGDSSAIITSLALWYCFIAVLVGMAFLALKTVPEARTTSNDFLHIAMLLVTVLALVSGEINM